MATNEIILVDAAIEVDDEPLTISANTIQFVEGQGESSVQAATKGSNVVVVTSEDITTKIGKIKFEMPASVQSLNVARDIKARGPGRVVRISGTDSQGNRLGRTMTQGSITNDPEKSLQNEGKLMLEFSGAPLAVS